jgi:hypothetical protein
MAFILMFTMQCLFPIFNLGQADSTGISIVNPDTQAREFTVTVTAPDGTNPRSGRVALSGRGHRARLLREILGTASEPSSGWIRIDSDVPGCRMYMTSQNEDSLIGTDAGSAGTNVLMTRISVNTGFTELSHTDTHIAIVNANTTAANVIVQLLGTDAVVRGNIAMTIAAQGSRTIHVSEEFAAVLPNNGLAGKTFEGSLRLISDAAIAGWLLIDKPLSRSILRGRAAADIAATNLALVPHFVFGGTYDASLNVLNPGTTAVNLELTALDDRGMRLGEVAQITLAVGESRRASIPELFRMVLPAIFPPPLITGYIRIRESQGQPFRVAGDILISSSSQEPFEASMLYPITDTASTIWMTPFAVSSPSYFTGYAIVNANELLTVQTDVQIEVVNGDGVVVSQSTVQLSPLNRRAALVTGPLGSGYLRFSSNFPVHIMATIGTTDLKTLDQLPVLR